MFVHFCTHVIKSITSYKWAATHKLAKNCALGHSFTGWCLYVMSIISWVQLIAWAWCSFAQAANNVSTLSAFCEQRHYREYVCVCQFLLDSSLSIPYTHSTVVFTYAKTPQHTTIDSIYTHSIFDIINLFCRHETKCNI